MKSSEYTYTAIGHFYTQLDYDQSSNISAINMQPNYFKTYNIGRVEGCKKYYQGKNTIQGELYGKRVYIENLI